MKLKVFSRSYAIVIASILFIGCGGDSTQNISTLGASKQPHKVIKSNADTHDEDIWHTDVTMTSEYNMNENNNFILKINCNKGISSDVEHFQIYIDTEVVLVDQRAEDMLIDVGGYTTSYYDFMIEDGSLFKYINESGSAYSDIWKWEYVDEVYYETHENDDGTYTILIDDDDAASAMFGNPFNYKIVPRMIGVAIEPIDKEWQDTGNYVELQKIKVNVIGDTALQRLHDNPRYNWYFTQAVKAPNGEIIGVSKQGDQVGTIFSFLNIYSSDGDYIRPLKSDSFSEGNLIADIHFLDEETISFYYMLRYFYPKADREYREPEETLHVIMNYKTNIVISNEIQNNKPLIYMFNYYQDSKSKYEFKIDNYHPKDKDWYAFFKIGDAHIRENIISWGYLNPLQVEENIFLLEKPKGPSTLVVFENGSYQKIVSTNLYYK